MHEQCKGDVGGPMDQRTNGPTDLARGNSPGGDATRGAGFKDWAALARPTEGGVCGSKKFLRCHSLLRILHVLRLFASYEASFVFFYSQKFGSLKLTQASQVNSLPCSKYLRLAVESHLEARLVALQREARLEAGAAQCSFDSWECINDDKCILHTDTHTHTRI